MKKSLVLSILAWGMSFPAQAQTATPQPSPTATRESDVTNHESLPEGVPNGSDFEKCLFIPGIYDSVEVILTGAPYVVNVQTVPDVPSR